MICCCSLAGTEACVKCAESKRQLEINVSEYDFLLNGQNSIKEYYKNAPFDFKVWGQEPPTENLTFFEAMKFLKDGWKIKREKYYYWLVLNKEKTAMYFEEDLDKPWNEFEFDYSDTIANDWKAKKIKE